MTEVPVAVTAFGVITALGLGAECLFRGLLEGRRGFRPVSAFGIEGCRVGLAAEVAVEVPSVGKSRTADLAILAVRDALTRLPRFVDPARVGVVLGSADAGTTALEHRLASGIPDPSFLAQYSKRRVVDEVAAAFGFTGPRHVVNTACSSGAVAIAIATDWLREGDCDIAIAVGSDELDRFTFSGFHALRAMDPEPCRPFDRTRRGLSMGEGAGCLVLERSAAARRRGCPIRGYVCSVGMSCDAYHLTAPDPLGNGTAQAIQAAFEAARIGPEAVGFINAHGTGTPLNDVAEVVSFERALGARAVNCPVHSVKATVGHCMGAAGAIEAVVALCSLEQGLVPPTAGLQDCEFDGRVNCVKGRPLEVNADFAMSTSFGFGGNNAAIVLSHARVYGGTSV